MKKTIIYIGTVAAAAAIAVIAIAGCNNGAGDTNVNVNNVLSRFDLTDYTVAFNGDGNDGGEAHGAVAVRIGTVITLPDRGTMQRGGHSFGGWHIGETFYPTGSSYTVTGDVTFYAVWNLDVPGAPGGVAATASPNSKSISVSWSPVHLADEYNVYSSTNPDGGYSRLFNTNNTSFTNNELSGGTAYCYKVSARNSAGEGAWSSSACAITIPDAPPMVTAKTESSTAVTVEWSPVPGANGYKVYRSSASPDGGYSLLFNRDSPEPTSFTNNNLQAGTIYYYKVSAYNDAGESGMSSMVGSPMTKPDIPKNVAVVSASSSSITVSWSRVNGATGYNVYRNASPSGNYGYLFSTPDISFTNNELSPNTNYCYMVTAYNGGGESGRSAYTCALTAPPVPTNVVLTSLSSNSITISWSSVAGAAGYKVYQSRSSSGNYSLLYTVESATTTSFTNNNLSAGTTYCYKVSAFNNSRIESDQSSNACAQTKEN
jgi:fibronectin type 3 domain-containing protein